MRRTDLIARLADITRRLALAEIDRSGVVAELRLLVAEIDPTDVVEAERPRGRVAPAHLEAWRRVFAYWKRAADKPRARATEERRKVVVARLRDGYSEADLCRAIDGCLASEYHVEHGYTDLLLICRNGAKVEQFAEMAGGVGAGADEPPRAADPARESLEARAMKALARGDVAAYERLKSELEGDGE